MSFFPPLVMKCVCVYVCVKISELPQKEIVRLDKSQEGWTGREKRGKIKWSDL